MSGSVKNRHKSPIPVRRERGDKEKGSSDGGTPHLPRPEPVSNQGSQEEGTAQSAGTEEEVKLLIIFMMFITSTFQVHSLVLN